MKIYEITIERGQDILEVFCAIDGLDDIFDEAENAYLNGKEPSDCESLMGCLKQNVFGEAKYFAYGDDEEDGVVPRHGCVIVSNYHMHFVEPIKWGDDPESCWDTIAEISLGCSFVIATEDSVSKANVERWVRSLGNINIEYGVEVKMLDYSQLQEYYNDNKYYRTHDRAVTPLFV